MAKRTYYRDAKGRFASKGTPGAKAVTVDVDREKKRIKKELNQKQRAKLDEVLARKQLSAKALTQVKKELDGMNLSELRKLTQKVGAKQPERYRNRKDAWKQAILGKLEGKKPGSAKPKVTAIKYSAETLMKRGEQYSARFNLDSGKELLAKRVELEKQIDLKRSELGGKLTSKQRLKLENEIGKLEDDFLKLRRESNQVLNKPYEDLIADIRKSSAITREQAELLANKINIDNSINTAYEPRLRKDMADFYELTGGRASDQLSNLVYTRDRAYSNGDTINIGRHALTGYSTRTLYHEMAHKWEYGDEGKQHLDAAIEWRKLQASSSKVDKLSNITGDGSYRDDEVALPGKYLNPYVGKVYSFNGKEYATEVTSIGLEHFANPADLRELRDKSPEHFNFIVGALVNDISS